MKWSIAGLLVLGLFAAVCASVLFVSFQNTASAGSSDPAAAQLEVVSTVPVLVAARDLAPRAVIAAEDMEVREVTEELVPGGSYADPVQVVGNVLVAGMSQGQAFTGANFAREGSGLDLASALAPGMRAVSVSLSDKMGIESLLYPGSAVDVIATMRLESKSGPQPISVTLLDNVLVLAIGERTIVSPDEEQRASTANSRTTVALLVTPEQAQKLKLAMEQGSVSLTLRNPMDDTEALHDGTRMSSLSPIFEAEEARERERLLALQEREAYALECERSAMQRAQEEIEKLRLEYEQRAADTEPDQEAAWETTIVRGGQVETKVFPVDVKRP